MVEWLVGLSCAVVRDYAGQNRSARNLASAEQPVVKMEQRSMMMSRAMSQRSVVIRPATQETGGMMQYLLTIVFLICTFWVVVGVLYFIYGKRALSSGKTVICSVRQSNARELWVFLPEGICSVFVALGLTLSDGTVQQGDHHYDEWSRLRFSLRNNNDDAPPQWSSC
ncbi:hypothetical protein HPB51_023966 [Rhipicephalus microplus]|uniref:Uncharacterized protein n=1 Tax=Rhipicephalus microplus TaxID=6941 RepID=A0A9J6DKE8_RHIMP|nr:hypothetical protein HPB51_023966 [Rhipicephalus microplus]